MIIMIHTEKSAPFSARAFLKAWNVVFSLANEMMNSAEIELFSQYINQLNLQFFTQVFITYIQVIL